MSKDPSKRLGTAGDWQEVIQHPWLKVIDIDDLLNKRIEPMYRPQLSRQDPADLRNFDEDFTTQEATISIIPAERQGMINIQKNLFDDFDS